jgi:superfamily II DNA/RNA helicase
MSPVLPLDPALEEDLGLEFKRYSCPGQRQAIRAVFFLKPGATLLINLPTGSGKSLVAWAPALMAPQGSLSLMVTPTVALALDQERQLREKYPPRVAASLPDRLAWHSGLSEADRTEIRRRLSDGTQRVLIASPESIVTSLARPLYDAAATGQLRYFIVDEAHLVAQWGTEFRPEFQSMCGLRRELLAHCPTISDRFRTLLLSATLSQESFEILRNLFAEDLFDHVSAVTLRPEPEYWISSARYEGIRATRVVELIRVVPRPFLLYVTTREQAKEWTERILQLGIRRAGCVHGATPSDVRSDVVDRWRSGELDCVIATSAFGLGMDKSDVRAVIHACVPESLDRFYQEVGRGGRDGKSCVSLLVYTEKDVEVARGISSERVITIDEGLPRWQAMVDHARCDYSTSRLYLDLTQRTPKITGDTAMNNAWNLRTLVLLNRAGLIAIESSRPPDTQRLANESDADFQNRRETVMRDYSVTCPVRLLDDGHRNRTTWENRIEPIRQALLHNGWNKFAVMERLLSGNREIASALSDAYTLRGCGTCVDLVSVCGGCPVCRATGHRQFSFVLPEPDAITSVQCEIDASIQHILGTGKSLLFVACPRSENGRMFRKKLFQFLLPALVRCGVREISAPAELQKDTNCRTLYRHSPNRFILHRDLGDRDKFRADLFLPRVTLFLTDSKDSLPEEIINIERPLHVVFAWDDIPDRARPDSRFFDRSVHTTFNGLLGRLSQ